LYNLVQKPMGWIEVICGSMFSGKTEELIRRLRRAQIARQKVAVFKPAVDSRYSRKEIVSHDMQKLPSRVVKDAKEIIPLALEAQVVGIDEAQFYKNNLVSVCKTLANMGKRVIVAGLDTDYRGVPFHPVPELLAIAESITKTHAICVVCGNPANFTQRKTTEKDQIVIGTAETYEARCRNCYEPPVLKQIRGKKKK
jgi:thymidine kinase